MADRRARDLELLDAIDAFKREPFARPVWRVAREGREPILGAATNSRWCDGTFDALYTSLDRDGALAEIHALLSSQPVFPSNIRSYVHKLAIDAKATLRLADLPALAKLGVNVERYRERDYTKTQAIADTAYFLGFDGLVAPSARWDCLNAVLFTDRVAPGAIAVLETEKRPVDWRAWRQAR
ncbi:MAG: RES domain-containing protein [Alphaproteobacteria bacterium]|nr:RES domain-containing protein [Alphaproteobacteria bacterium]MBM3653568.1 RES domain-containing protein [Alphaproteobacteria bacterium]